MNIGWERSLGTSLLWISSIVLADQATKWLAVSQLVPYEPQEVLGNILRWMLVYNPGGVFGLFSQYGSWFLIFSAIIVLIIIVILTRYFDTRSHIRTGLISIAAGAVGNLVDRFGSGSVVDFIDFGISDTLRWPTFNIADIAIIGGTMLVLWHMIWSEKKA